MNLEDVRAELRPRSYAEAVDLGFRMGRRWWKPMASSAAITVAPMFVLGMLLAWGNPWFVLALLWWLKPVIERVPLFILSRVLFGQEPSVREALRQAPSLFLRKDALLSLTLFRFDPFRSARLPIWQLEGSSGGRARAKLVLRGVESEILSLTALCYLFEWVLAMTPVFILFAFHSGLASRFGEIVDIEGPLGLPPAWVWTFNLFWIIAAVVLQPFYVAGGFSLYLNRRTHLEGWDIEVAFRRLARRLSGAAAAVLIACLFLTGTAAAQAPAGTIETLVRETVPDPDAETDETTSDLDRDDEKSTATIERVLEDPEFGATHIEEKWGFDWDIFSDGGGDAAALDLGPFLNSILRPLLVVLVVVGLALLIVQILLRLDRLDTSDVETDPDLPPQQLFGLDVRKESLPPDIVGTARGLWAGGDARGAIGLLYRASVARLVTDEGLTIKESATESECLRQVAAEIPGERLGYFRLLTESWQSTAYGHRPPGLETAEELFDRWNTHFGAPA